MRHELFLAWRYVRYHRIKSTLLVLALTMTASLPFSVDLLVSEYEKALWRRARATPLVLGSKGNRFDLVLQALYFRPSRLDPVPYGVVRKVASDGLCRAIPLAAGFTAGDQPIIGTTLDYLEWRGLRCARGRLPGLVGEAVVGHDAARILAVEPGDTLTTDQVNVYDLARTFPLRLRITGVLAPSHSPDDAAIFVDVRTHWILEGRGHGHTELDRPEASEFVLERSEGVVTANAAVETYVEITPENVESFHFHGDMADFPLSAILLLPRDEKAATILEARYRLDADWRVLDPSDVIADLVGFIFRVKRFFDANFVVVGISTFFFLVLVIVLSGRLRAGEFRTLHRIGAGRMIVLKLFAGELLIVLALSAILAGAIAGLLLMFAPDLFRIL
ncbi:MAG TPA: hypothetical protein VK116_11655 [Planctomycetota bacterium]|nr:hypothetical protein [Planctomycetota bacterium]